MRIARLKVLELILENAEKQGWKLRQRHLEALEKTFAESQDITTCLDTKSDSLTEVDEMRIQLAIMLLSQRERVADLTYTQRMEWEVFEKDMQDDKDLESPLLQDFHITVKVYEGERLCAMTRSPQKICKHVLLLDLMLNYITFQAQ